MNTSRLILAVALFSPFAFAGGEEAVSFNRDIRPLLAAKCFACHGPDEDSREADLRLDHRAAATESGAVVAGKPEESELIGRVTSDDPDLRMPPGDGDALTDAEVDALRNWIASGAEYSRHWAFEVPTRPAICV